MDSTFRGPSDNWNFQKHQYTHGPWELSMFSNVPLSTVNNVKTKTEANPLAPALPLQLS